MAEEEKKQQEITSDDQTGKESIAKAMGGTTNEEGQIVVDKLEVQEELQEQVEDKKEEENKEEEKKEETKSEETKEEEKEEKKEEEPKGEEGEEKKEEEKTEEGEEKKEEEKKEEEEEKAPELSGSQEEGSEEEEVEVDANEWLSDYTEGKHGDIDELIKKAEGAGDNPELSERAKKFVELEAKGIDPMEALKYEALGLDKLDPNNDSDRMSIIRMKMKDDDPDMNERQIDLLMKKEYGVGDEEVEGEDKEMYELKMSGDARKFKRELEAKAQEAQLPKHEEKEEEKSEEEGAQKEEERTQMKQAWESNVKEYMGTDEAKTETFILDKDGNKIDFVLNDKGVESLTGLMSDVDGFFSRYMKEDGSTDMAKYRREMLVLDNLESYTSAIYGQGVSVGAKKIVSGQKNADPKTEKEGADSTPKSIGQQVAAATPNV